MKATFTPLVIAVLIAAVANQVLFFIAGEFFGEQFIVDTDGAGTQAPMEVPTFLPAVFTVFQGLVGAVVVAAIALWTATPRSTWWIITLIGLALSLSPTAFAAQGVFSTFAWLSLMHLVAGAVIIPFVAKALPEQKTTHDSDSPKWELPEA
jgi:ABC-type long-subunit fatty acid transport system fused permease/ATPase subunit